MRIFHILLMCTMVSYSAWGQSYDSTDIKRIDTLHAIVVKGNLPNTRMKGDAIVTKIEGTSLGASGSVEEMLVKVPGLTGNEDKIEVLGKGVPLIYINGRQLRDESELKRLRSEDIHDVKVIHNPGAKYNATIKAIVKIRTKRKQGDGLSYDLEATDEQDLRYGFNKPSSKVNVNYRKGDIDVFGTVWYRHQDYRQYSSLEEMTSTNKIFQQSGPYTMTWANDKMTYTFGSNWQINKKHSIGFQADLTQQLWGRNKVIYDEDIYENDSHIDHLYSEQTSDESQPLTWLANTYYNGEIGNLGIDFNADYMTSEINTNRKNQETSLIQNDRVLSRSGAKSNLFATKLILSHPIGKGTFEAGTEITVVNRHNIYWIDKVAINNTDAIIKENTVATFADYECDLKEYGKASLGLRYEHTVLDYDDKLGNSENLHRLTDNLFPSVSYTKNFGKLQAGISYSAKTVRPNYFALNDAITYISRYSLQAGNTKLKNESLHELTLNSSWKWLSLTASYEQCRNCISQWSYLLDNDIVIIRHINLDRPINIFNMYLSVTPHVGLWSLNATTGIQKQDFYLNLEDQRATDGTRKLWFNKPVFIANIFNTFSFKNDWKFDINLMFSSKGHQQNFYNDYNACRVGVSVQKNLLRNKSLTLRASLTDILQRQRYNEFGDMGYYQIQQNNRYSQHKFSLSAFYRFNNTRSKYKGSGAGKEAQNRMKG